MSEQGAKPEVLPGDLITKPGLYESRCGDIVPIIGWGEGWWVSEWNGTRDWYGSDGRQRFDGGLPNQWQLLHWVGPLAASEPEPETTSEQLAEIEAQAMEFTPPDGWRPVPLGETLRGGDEYHQGLNRYIRRIEPEPQPEPEAQPEPVPVQVCEGRWKTRGGGIRNVTAIPTEHSLVGSYPWWNAASRETWRANGRYDFGEECLLDLVTYLGPIEPQPEPQPEAEAQPQPDTIQIREGRWKTRGGEVRNVTPTPESDGREERFPWWDARFRQTWRANGRYHCGGESVLDLVEYLEPIKPQPERSRNAAGTKPEPQPPMLQDADQRIRLLEYANNTQAEAIGQLQGEAHVLNMEIGGLERQLVQRDARIRDLETLHAAATQAVVDAGKANDALWLQVQNRQNKCEQQKGRIDFLETLNAGNGAAISDYRTQVEKLQGLVDTARGQLEAAATERDELRAAIDAADKQLDQKDAQIRDLRIELDAAQQVPQPVSDDERERIWDDATEQAGRQVIRWLRPLTLALNRQPDPRFSRFMALTLSVLPDIVPELLGYAVEDEAEGDCEE